MHPFDRGNAQDFQTNETWAGVAEGLIDTLGTGRITTITFEFFQILCIELSPHVARLGYMGYTEFLENMGLQIVKKS